MYSSRPERAARANRGDYVVGTRGRLSAANELDKFAASGPVILAGKDIKVIRRRSNNPDSNRTVGEKMEASTC